MENHDEDPAAVEEEEELPDEFQCCVCLDLLYKPVVLACGHVSCFWCVFRAMERWQVSLCPVCRHPYNHFPSICQLLHFLLLTLYPVAYKRREQQVIEEEKMSEVFSPQLDNCFRLEPSKGLNICSGVPPHSTTSSCKKVCLGSCSIVEGEPSTIKGSESALVPHKEDEMSIPAELSFEATEKVASKQNSMLGDKLNQQQLSKQFPIADFLCVICEKLLYRPVVLNCGHVYCEGCIVNPNYQVPRCHICQSAHPNGSPKVCLVLQHFLEEQFSNQYILRKEAVYKQADGQNGSPPALPGSTQSRKDAAQLPSIFTSDDRSWLSGQKLVVHFKVGCDYCGMYPIIGERYRCKDCSERIGFDLCEGCYNSSSKLPGRFNQQHTPEHKLEKVPPRNMGYFSEAEYSDESDAPEDMEDVPPLGVGFAGFPNVSENNSSASSSGDTLEDEEHNNPSTI